MTGERVRAYWIAQLGGWFAYAMVHYLSYVPALAPGEYLEYLGYGGHLVTGLLYVPPGIAASSALGVVYGRLLARRTRGSVVALVAACGCVALGILFFLMYRVLLQGFELLAPGEALLSWPAAARSVLGFTFALVAWSGVWFGVVSRQASQASQLLTREARLRMRRVCAPGSAEPPDVDAFRSSALPWRTGGRRGYRNHDVRVSRALPHDVRAAALRIRGEVGNVGDVRNEDDDVRPGHDPIVVRGRPVRIRIDVAGAVVAHQLVAETYGFEPRRLPGRAGVEPQTRLLVDAGRARPSRREFVVTRRRADPAVAPGSQQLRRPVRGRRFIHDRGVLRDHRRRRAHGIGDLVRRGSWGHLGVCFTVGDTTRQRRGRREREHDEECGAKHARLLLNS